MPIRKELRKFYRTPEWYAAREAVKSRSNDRCERCGGLNHTAVLRREGIFCLRIVIIQCGCAHLDHDPANNSPSNLAWLCRGDHLAHDTPLHVRNSREKRIAKKDHKRGILDPEGWGRQFEEMAIGGAS